MISTRVSSSVVRALGGLAAIAAISVTLDAQSASTPPAPPTLSFGQVAALPAPAPEARISYGTDSLQFGELRLPKGKGPFPTAVLLHGGCWLAAYDLAHLRAMSAALATEGFAVWTPEYRRLGNPGGGIPGTIADAANATDHLRVLARQYPLDTSRVVLVGHSAGGQLALLVAGRPMRRSPHPLSTPTALRVTGVVALAAISDLGGYAATTGCGGSVPRLLGGVPGEVPEAYARWSPSALLPLGVPVRLLHGYFDKTVPMEQSRRFARAAFAAGDDAQFIMLEHSAHFDPVAPTSADWPAVLSAIRALTRDF